MGSEHLSPERSPSIGVARIFAVGSGYHALKRENLLTLFLTPTITLNPYHYQVSIRYVVAVEENIRGHRLS